MSSYIFCVKVHLNFFNLLYFSIAAVLACHANIQNSHRIGAELTTYCRGPISYGQQYEESTRMPWCCSKGEIWTQRAKWSHY